MPTKLEKGLQILKVRQAMLEAGVPMSKWPALPKSPVKKTPARRTPNPDAPKYTWAPWGTSGVVHDNCYDYAFGSFSSKRSTKSVPGNRSGIGSNGLTFTTCKGIVQRVLSDNPNYAVYHMKTPNAKPKPGYYKVMAFVAPHNDFGNSTGDFHWYKQISGIRYKTRPGDTVETLARFFHVTKKTITDAYKTSTRPKDATDGKVANDEEELRILNRMNQRAKGTKLAPGRVLDFPVCLWSHKTGWAGGPLIVDASGKTIVDPRRCDRKYKPGFHYDTFCSAYAVKRGMAKTGNNSNRNGLNQGLANRVLTRLS